MVRQSSATGCAHRSPASRTLRRPTSPPTWDISLRETEAAELKGVGVDTGRPGASRHGGEHGHGSDEEGDAHGVAEAGIDAGVHAGDQGAHVEGSGHAGGEH